MAAQPITVVFNNITRTTNGLLNIDCSATVNDPTLLGKFAVFNLLVTDPTNGQHLSYNQNIGLSTTFGFEFQISPPPIPTVGSISVYSAFGSPPLALSTTIQFPITTPIDNPGWIGASDITIGIASGTTLAASGQITGVISVTLNNAAQIHQTALLILQSFSPDGKTQYNKTSQQIVPSEASGVTIAFDSVIPSGATSCLMVASCVDPRNLNKAISNVSRLPLSVNKPSGGGSNNLIVGGILAAAVGAGYLLSRKKR